MECLDYLAHDLLCCSGLAQLLEVLPFHLACRIDVHDKFGIDNNILITLRFVID